MTNDSLTSHLERVLKSKQQFRRQLADLPITEKLRLLDALRERALDIQASKPRPTIATGKSRPGDGSSSDEFEI